MKAITLWQPWASFVALGVKTIETRGWDTSYRGPLAIHAAKRRVHSENLRLGEWHYQAAASCLWRGGESHAVMEIHHGIPYGAVVATCELVDVIPTSEARWADDLEGESWMTEVIRSGADDVRRIYLSEFQRPYGDFTPGRFAWLLGSIKALSEPVEATGRQGFWEWSAA